MKEISKKVGLAVAALSIFALTAVGAISGTSAHAAPAKPKEDTCAGVGYAIEGGCGKNDFTMDNVWGWVGTVTGWLLTAVGVICVIFIIIGGIKYATSGGDDTKVKNAKNTLLYAIIGLAIAILANVIVNLVTGITTGDGGLFTSTS